MADNVAVTPGVGAAISTDELGDGSHAQNIKLLVSGNGDGTRIPADATNGLLVDVSRVQGTVSVVQSTPANLKVDASGVAVPVTDNSGSLTVDAPANAPVHVRGSDGASAHNLPSSAQLPAALSGGRLDVVVGAALPAGAALIGKLQISDGSEDADVTAANALKVDGSAVTQPVSGTVAANQGTQSAVANAWPVKISDETDTVGVSTVGSDKALQVDVIQSVGPVALDDKSGFTEGSGKVLVVGGVFNDTIAGDPAEDQLTALRITAKKGLHANLRNASGAEIGVSAAPLRTDPTGTTTQPVRAAQVSAQFNNEVTGITGGHSAQALWTPTGGFKFVVRGLLIAAGTGGDVKVFDGTAATGKYLFNGPVVAGVVVVPFPEDGWRSAAADTVLRYTTDANFVGSLVAYGYEAA